MLYFVEEYFVIEGLPHIYIAELISLIVKLVKYSSNYLRDNS